MTSPALARKEAPAGAAALPDVPVAWGALLAVLAFALFHWASGGIPDHATFFDSDDATRLVAVRDLLAGASWFDTTIDRFGGAYPLHSHWSRLVDLPIAALIALFSTFVAPETAEVAARTIWPLTVFAALLAILGRAAEARGGRMAGVMALVLAVLCLSGTMQFAPGRIDHHNVMILAAVGGVLLLAQSFTRPRIGWIAGGLMGLGVAVGYEGLLLTAMALAVASLIAVLSGAGRSGLRRAALGFAMTLSVAYLLTTDPERWRYVSCDALGLNVVMMASAAAIGLSATLHLRSRRSLEIRLAALVATGITALAMFVVVEPACVQGPFAGLDPRIWPIWLDRVMETHGLIWLAGTVPLVALVYLAHVLLGCAASLSMWRTDRDWAVLLYTSVLVLWSLASIWQAKLMPYAAFLAIPAIAVAMARLPDAAAPTKGLYRMGGLALGNQFALLAVGALLVGPPEVSNASADASMAVRRACLTRESIAPLAHLSKGLVAAHSDLGPFLVANTQLDVLAAPYHRLDRQIIEVHEIFAAEPDEARRRLERAGVAYVVICNGSKAAAGTTGSSLSALLRQDKAPAFLERVRFDHATPLDVWRVR